MSFIKFSGSFLLFLVFSLLSVNCSGDDVSDDSGSMAKLAAALRPLPRTWSTNSSSSYCKWHGVKCASSMHVVEIDLNDMALSGSLPSEFPPFPYLQVLRLSRNKLTGPLPRLNKLPLLKKLYLMKNKFKTIPPGFFQGLSNNLQVLMLGQNPFLGTWTIPLEFTKFRNLSVFSAYNTNLEGSIPDIFDSLALTTLSLEENNLTGSLPPSLWRSQIQELHLFDQKVGLTGTIDMLSNMNSLSTVVLGNNKFTGTIPDLSNCRSLQFFALGYNQFTGTIPDLTNCKRLRVLELRYNNFSGVVPRSLGSHSSLKFIFIDHNMLQGPFPSFMLVSISMVLYNNYCTDTGDPCDFQVTMLLEIASAWMYPYKLSLGWKGNDACRNWSFVKCNQENNITEIDLRNQRLQGTISPAFGNLTELQYLNLSDNNLIGSIPECLTKLPNLKVLDVSNNNLSGIIPNFASSVKLITSGNDLLIPNTTADAPNAATKTGSASGSSLKGKRRGLKAGIVTATIIGVIFCLFVGWRITRRGNEDHLKKDESCPELFSHNMLGKSQSGVEFKEPQQLDFGKLVIATNNFHPTNVLGKGGFGLVYKGKLHDGQEIAVKRLSSASGQGLEEFMNEATVISKLQHRNLVRLLGCCIDGEERMLAFEYMPNKSLDVSLFDSEKRKVLDWRKRFNIIQGTSRGLLYLHRDSRLQIVHRDLKASNILLDEQLNPKISDFGIAKIFCSKESQANTNRVFGTYGYMAPEYAMKGQFSEKSDVFSFGVLTLEIVSGRRNSNFQEDEHSQSLLGYAWKLWSEGRVSELIDTSISSDPSCHKEIFRCIHVGLLCVQNFAKHRPPMSMVVLMLSREIENLPMPKPPPFFDEKTAMESITITSKANQ